MAPGDNTPPTPEDAIQQGLDGTADTPTGDAAPVSGDNWQQQLLVTLTRLDETMATFQRREMDQPPKSEKLQPAPNLADQLPHGQPQAEEEQRDEPDFPAEAEAEPITFEQTASASVASGFQQQQQAGAVDMGQGLNSGGAVLEQMQAAMQALQESNQKTTQIMQTVAASMAQLLQIQHQFSEQQDQLAQQFEALQTAIEALAEEVQAGQSRNPQSHNGANP